MHTLLGYQLSRTISRLHMSAVDACWLSILIAILIQSSPVKTFNQISRSCKKRSECTIESAFDVVRTNSRYTVCVTH